jgi:hypothetical protein
VSFREAGHLPKLRPDGVPADPRRLPRQRNGITPQMHGRYPDYDVLDQAEHWDEATRRVVLARLDDPAPIRFFTAAEAATLEAFCDTVTAQDSEPRIPILAFVDSKLYNRELDGFRYADLPDDRDTWRLVAQGLDDAAEESFGAACFAVLSPDRRRVICDRFSRGNLRGGAWDRLNVERAWKVVLRSVLAAFYSHPWAWNEIGYGGPAYPRGFARLGVGQSEAWEGEEAVAPDPVAEEAQRSPR